MYGDGEFAQLGVEGESKALNIQSLLLLSPLPSQVAGLGPDLYTYPPPSHRRVQRREAASCGVKEVVGRRGSRLGSALSLALRAELVVVPGSATPLLPSSRCALAGEHQVGPSWCHCSCNRQLATRDVQGTHFQTRSRWGRGEPPCFCLKYQPWFIDSLG